MIVTQNVPIFVTVTTNVPTTTEDVTSTTRHCLMVARNIPIVTRNIPIVARNIPIVTRNIPIGRESDTHRLLHGDHGIVASMEHCLCDSFKKNKSYYCFFILYTKIDFGLVRYTCTLHELACLLVVYGLSGHNKQVLHVFVFI